MNVLCLSLEELAQLSLNNLLRYETLQRACKSSIYKEKWAGIDVDKIITYEDFSQLPYTTANEVRQAMYEQPIDQFCVEKWSIGFQLQAQQGFRSGCRTGVETLKFL
jgi:phenylacetate-coenzyme A ligase PaaK-like adenylate-forming protein